ncbi:hypothetical protein [Vibrio panuliri]|uniref:Uncharacterized protein n=1 Tax=Vibrio panuliri TaxID=1381081 RepID=A0ABX3FCD7_9VIBR|nr:hypothetical protein [Vibrio panuliri]KAB1458284.1 hypothetical protein F7O85_11320 [Vibrio panuliri]OLQ86803.1 hypothetical protein BIY20_02625 [Vibrio panuliri]
MTKMSAVLIFGLFAANAVACENNYYGFKSHVDVPQTFSLYRDCLSNKPLLSHQQGSTLDYGLLSQSNDKDYSEYWSDWVLKSDANPFFSQNYSSSYFGIGVWSPDELDGEDELTTQEWLLNHGLQFSVGFGEKKNGEPRVRLDYMWHDDEKNNVMMQVELPF